MHCGIRTTGAEYLAEMLESIPKLEVLQLDGNNVGDLGAEALAEGLKHNRALQVKREVTSGARASQCFT